MTKNVSQGVVHTLPSDLRSALLDNVKALTAWEDITPLARNEWICWVTAVKKAETREQHVKRAIEDLAKGKRRPCCWPGCTHRKDKALSPSQKFVLSKKNKK